MSFDCSFECNNAREWWRELALEFFGTSLYVGAVSTAAVASTSSVPVVAGYTLIGLLYMVQEASKQSIAHFNPAVTTAFALAGEVSFPLAGLVIVAQFVGGICGGLLAWMFTSEGGRKVRDLGVRGIPDTFSSYNYTLFNGLMLELFLSFVFVLPFYVLYRKSRKSEYQMAAPLAIGLFTQGIVTVVAPFTGSIFNPAYALGTAIIAGEFDDFWVYLAIPFVGAALAVLAYKSLFIDEDCVCCACGSGGKAGGYSGGYSDDDDYTYDAVSGSS